MRRIWIPAGVLAFTVICLSTGSAGPLTATPPVPASGTSPYDATCGLTPGADDFFGTGVVFLNSEVEPWVDVNPMNSNIVAAIWQQDRWSNGGARGNVMAISYDGGATWPDVVTFPGVTKCTDGPFDRASDPWLSFAPNGDLHIMHLVLNIEPPPGKPGGFGSNGMMVQKVPFSAFSDGDVDETDPNEVTPPILIAFDDRGDLHDKNSLTADPTDSNFVYAVWDFLDIPQGAILRPDRAVALGFKGAALFSRSADGGQTWSEPKVLHNPGGVNQTVVNPNSGRLFNFFVEILNFRNDDKGAKFELNVSMKFSDDKGMTWLPHGRPIRIGKIRDAIVLDPDQFGVEPEPFDRHRTGDIIIDPAVDPITGALYVVWQDIRFTGRPAIAITMSSDDGRTWSAPIKVNQTPVLGNLNDQAFLPSVHVLPNGTVGVSYYDFRNNAAGGGTDTDYFLVHCHGACSSEASWVGETKITVASFNSRLAPVARGFFLGDYVGLDDTGTAFSVLYTEGVSAANPTDEFYSTVSP
jgi:hypothetical protein